MIRLDWSDCFSERDPSNTFTYYNRLDSVWSGRETAVHGSMRHMAETERRRACRVVCDGRQSNRGPSLNRQVSAASPSLAHCSSARTDQTGVHGVHCTADPPVTSNSLWSAGSHASRRRVTNDTLAMPKRFTGLITTAPIFPGCRSITLHRYICGLINKADCLIVWTCLYVCYRWGRPSPTPYGLPHI